MRPGSSLSQPLPAFSFICRREAALGTDSLLESVYQFRSTWPIVAAGWRVFCFWEWCLRVPARTAGMPLGPYPGERKVSPFPICKAKAEGDPGPAPFVCFSWSMTKSQTSNNFFLFFSLFFEYFCLILFELLPS